MVRYPGVRFVLISPKELALPDYIKEDFLLPSGVEFVETADLEGVISSLDILYMTRIQAERFESKEEYDRLKDSYILNKSKLNLAKPDLSIMHPLPRVNEIDVDVDEDSRAHYFDQAELGRYIRMALIIKLLSTKDVDDRRDIGEVRADLVCKNPHCISRTERGVKRLFDGTRCIYCDQRVGK
jgi:aspartate carbamoyltransferase catalytic subunit